MLELEVLGFVWLAFYLKGYKVGFFCIDSQWLLDLYST